jgi:hypothetical protein
MLSQDQFMGQLRQILPALGWILILTGKVTPETWGTFMSVVPPAIGGLIVLGSAGWALLANTRASILKSVAAMKETSVKDDGQGNAIILVKDKELSDAAKQAATPLTVGK